MKLFLLLLFSLVYLSAAEPGWFDVFTDNSNSFNDDIFAKAYATAKKDAAEMNKKIEEEDKQREKNLPKFKEGSIGGKIAKVIGSAKKASQTYISGVKQTATELTKSLIGATTNAGIDLLIREFKLITGSTGMGSKLPLPDIQTGAYGCEVTATGGYFSSLSSLEKCGKIKVDILDSDTVILELPMKFKEMKVVFNELNVTAFFIGLSGSFSIEIGNNSVVIKLRLGMDADCALNVERVVIKELGGFIIKFEGMGSYANMLSQMLINYMKENIAHHIQDAVDSNLRKALANNPLICSKLIPT